MDCTNDIQNVYNSKSLLYFSLYLGGVPLLFGTINSFVHLIMYSYYLISTINPDYKKNIWWKRYLTKLQMVSSQLQTIANISSEYIKII